MLHIITGPMFSGKTVKLQGVLQYYSTKKKTVLFQPDLQGEHLGGISVIDHRKRLRSATSHDDGQRSTPTHYKLDSAVPATVYVRNQPSVSSFGSREYYYPVYAKDTDDYEVVGFDGLEFFGYDILSTIGNCLSLGKTVVIAGINKDYKGREFQPIGELLARADKITLLSAVCAECGEPAGYTHRIGLGRKLLQEGGKREYTTYCRKHFFTIQRELNREFSYDY